MGTEIQFLRQFELFSKAADSLLRRLATRATTRKFGSNQLVVRQGERPDYVYFIRSGSVKVIFLRLLNSIFQILRKIDIRKSLNFNFIEDKSVLLDPDRYDMDDGKASYHLMQIDELRNFHLF